MVTVEDASRMLAPLVAQEVEKETKKIEIRMQVRRVRVFCVIRMDGLHLAGQ